MHSHKNLAFFTDMHYDIVGFDKNSIQKACCGIGGEYNIDAHKKCGVSGVVLTQVHISVGMEFI